MKCAIFVICRQNDMKYNYIHIFVLLMISILLAIPHDTAAQEKIGGGLEVDKMVHNFGDIRLGSGAVSCTFTLTNTSDKPAVIYNVVSSCGCTDVEWTREPIMPGKKGKISVTYSNDEGPYPFDKTLTVYLSEVKKPVLLKIRGNCIEKPKPLEDLYTVAFGPFALKADSFHCGNIDQGEERSDAVMVANLSNKPIEIEFDDISKHLDISVSPNPIPARSTAEMSFSVSSCRKVWGKNTYTAFPVINGQKQSSKDGKEKLSITAFTKENFDNVSSEEKSNGPRPMFKESTFQAGKIKEGTVINASFTFTNEGKKPFGVYKVDIDTPRWSHGGITATQPGGRKTFNVDIDTTGMPKGEMLVIITLTTNSPLRPIVNIFVAGWIE